ncbi:MAG: CD1871A family CXXC motif-containing protein [Lachnospiraceae bacterium]|nr:CD1871A family CXXC motif-containing protein [Lachnospiraceae bacterium]
MKKKHGTLIALVSSILLIIVGLIQGQNTSVLAKAIKICLECIGIG